MILLAFAFGLGAPLAFGAVFYYAGCVARYILKGR